MGGGATGEEPPMTPWRDGHPDERFWCEVTGWRRPLRDFRAIASPLTVKMLR